MVDDFVGRVNSVVRHQEEVEKVKAVSQRLATTSIVHDVHNGWEKVLTYFLNSVIIIVVTVLGALYTTRLVSPHARSKCTATKNFNYRRSFTL